MQALRSRIGIGRLLTGALAVGIYLLCVGANAGQLFSSQAARSFSSLTWTQLGIWALVSLIFLAVGVLVWLYARDRRVALLLFSFSCTMMVNFALLDGARSGNASFALLCDTISNASTALSVPFLAALLLLFPKSYFSGAHLRHALFQGLLRGYLACLGMLSIVIVLATVVNAFLFSQTEAFSDGLDVLKDAHYLLGIIGILATITFSYVRLCESQERQQLRLFVGGVLFALLPILLLTVLPSIVNAPQTVVVDGHVSALALVLLPIALGYSILRHQILIFDTYIRRVVAGIVGLVGLALLGYLTVAVGSLVASTSISVYVIGVAVVMGVLAPSIWVHARGVTDWLFFRENLSYRHLIEKPMPLGNEKLTLEKAAQLITLAAVNTFMTPQACLLVLDATRQSYRACPSLRADDPTDAPRWMLLEQISRFLAPGDQTRTEWAGIASCTVERLAEASRPLLLNELTRAGSEEPMGLARYLTSAQALEGTNILLAPLRAQGMMIGMLILGERAHRYQYAGPDFDVVELLLGRFASVVETAYLMQELRASNEQLLTTNEQLETAYERQKELDYLKDQLMVNVSHELRTPLSEVSGYLDLLKSYQGMIEPSVQATFVEKASHGCEELLHLIITILEAAQSGSALQQTAVQAVPLGQVIHEEIDNLDPHLAGAYHIERQVAGHIQAQADLQAVRQVLRNLLSNALKYSPTGTTITVSAHERGDAPEETPTVCVRVTDQGPGIPASEQALLFGKFVRLQRDLSGSIRGTGLGLYISKQLVEAMGGAIWVESRGVEGQGSTFQFTLPLARPSGKKAHVREVEDDEHLRNEHVRVILSA